MTRARKNELNALNLSKKQAIVIPRNLALDRYALGKRRVPVRRYSQGASILKGNANVTQPGQRTRAQSVPSLAHTTPVPPTPPVPSPPSSPVQQLTRLIDF